MKVKYVANKSPERLEEYVPAYGDKFRIDGGNDYILAIVSKGLVLINLKTGARYADEGDLQKICKDLNFGFRLVMPDGYCKSYKFVPCKSACHSVKEVLITPGLRVVLKTREVMAVWVQRLCDYILVDTTTGEVVHSEGTNSACDYLNAYGNNQ